MTDDHLSLDELAELDEDLLPPERARDARAHLDGCLQCRASADSLTSTRAALAGLPAEPMPDAVKARLDRALADAATKPTATIVPSIEAYRRRRFGRPTMAASAAAAAIVLVVGAIVVAAVSHPSTSDGGAAGGTGLAAGSAPRIPTAEPSQPQDFVRTSTGLDYTPAGLLADIPGLVAKVPSGDAAGAPSPGVVAPEASGTQLALENGPVPAVLRPLYNSHAKLLKCAAFVSQTPNAVPIAIDFGRWTDGDYHAAPSIIFVLKDPNPEVADVYVTSPTCSGNSPLRTFVKVPLR